MSWLLILGLPLIIAGIIIIILGMFFYNRLFNNFEIDEVGLAIIAAWAFIIGFMLLFTWELMDSSEEESSIPEVVETTSPDYDKDTHYYIIADNYTDTEHQYSLYEIENDNK